MFTFCVWGALHWVFIVHGPFIAATGLSLVAASRGYSLVVVCRLLTGVASLVAEHRLPGVKASVVVGYRFSCLKACGIFPDQGSNPCPVPWPAGP